MDEVERCRERAPTSPWMDEVERCRERAPRYWVVTLLALLTAACTTPPILTPRENPQLAWQDRQAQLLPLTTWKLAGRVAVRSAQEGGQVSMRWERNPQGQNIDLSGPLGRGLIRLQQDENGARLQDSNQRVHIAPNAEALLFNTTGWRIPLEGLHYWIRGLPAPGAPARQELDDQGRLAILWQSGWEIRFLAYTRFGIHDLPSRLTLILPQEAVSATTNLVNSPVEARLIIERWLQLQ